jgi:hypothetical protein
VIFSWSFLKSIAQDHLITLAQQPSSPSRLNKEKLSKAAPFSKWRIASRNTLREKLEKDRIQLDPLVTMPYLN